MKNLKRIDTRRDVLLLKGSKEIIAVACDSSGGVGPKNADSVKASATTVGRYAVRTVLLELLSIGADVIAISAALPVEYDGTARLILKGIKQLLREISLNPPLIWSTEKNFTVCNTYAGVTAIGTTDYSRLRLGCSKRGDCVLLLGEPSVGEQVLASERAKAVPSVKDVITILNSGLTHEMIPVGSRGVLYETQVLARDSGIEFEASVDVKKLNVSAGPSTALLLTANQANASILKEKCKAPLRQIGYMR